MSKIFVPSKGMTDWQALLGSPTLHWKRTKSAYELAASWEGAAADGSRGGLPEQVYEALNSHSELSGVELLLAIPEHCVAVPGKGRKSQTDLWALLKCGTGLVSMAVEGKAGEDFDKPVSEWLTAGKSERSPANRRQRLELTCAGLGLDIDMVLSLDLRYQLLHRTYSAVLEAQRFGANHATMLVQAFLPSAKVPATAGTGHLQQWSDFEAFCAALSCPCARGAVDQLPAKVGEITLWLGWLDCELVSNLGLSKLSETPLPPTITV